MIWAGIVLFNPNYNRLKNNIQNVLPNVDKLVLFNNGIDAETKKYIVSLGSNKVTILGNGENKGIAYALNSIMREAYENQVKWVITFDQDSITPLNYTEQVKKRIIDNTQRKLGIVCPIIVDKRRIYPANRIIPDTTNDYNVEMCITSGSCTSVEAWNDVGGFDDFLFIDLVDNDFCKRLRSRQWIILRMGNVQLDQEFGNITPRSKKVTDFFRFICKRIPNQRIAVNLSKLAYKKTVSPTRVYYTNRNILYLNEKLRVLGGIGYESYNAKSYLGFLLFFNLPSLLRGKEKSKILKAIISGRREGKIASKKAEHFCP